jgi:hypothetical protein
VRIPLDYYRILGLPIQAAPEQLQQAYRDRTLQLPRREFSDGAIASRKALLDEAYGILSNPEKRQAYDSDFLSASYEVAHSNNGDRAESTSPTPSPSEGYAPTVEIQEPQFVGALLILLELGEYELVLKLGRPYLSSGNATLSNGRYGDPDIVLADVVLAIALSCLELGREQWQQGHYELAAESLETGQELLLREGLFAALRGEIQSDLYKLRPYRVLELLAEPEQASNYHDQHQRGLGLLRGMLDDRGGIDGTGDDQSGLSVDDFLRFIQQLRTYLTAEEQQVLFEAEARRPSAVATYLAVYALLARGFAQRQPALIRRAKLMLIRLGVRQDVYLERSICALLLGQTEEASQALEMSQELDSLAFIKEHSEGSPDLLPGLCLYAERWLQNEVFPHFQDLAKQQASLKDYFADEQVQSYLEELPNEPEPMSQWQPAATGTFARSTQSHAEVHNGSASRASRGYASTVGQAPSSASRGATATATLDHADTATANGSVPTAERIAHPSSTTDYQNGQASMMTGSGRSPRTVPDRRPSRGQTPPPSAHRRSPSRGRYPVRLDRLMFLVAVGLVGIIVVGVVLSKITQAVRGQLTVEGLTANPSGVSRIPLQLNDLLTSTQEEVVVDGPLTDESAKQVVMAWLSAKSLAMGEGHDTSTLSQILAEPALSQWQQLSAQAQANNSYRQFNHTVTVISVTQDEATPDQASVEAEVAEAATIFENGQQNDAASYDDTLRVQYDLVRDGEQWKIRSMTVLN